MELMPPEVPVARKMTAKQIELLRKIVASNGGGVSVHGPYLTTAKALIERHMIQGKRGQQSVAVHTHIGLEWVRNNPE